MWRLQCVKVFWFEESWGKEVGCCRTCSRTPKASPPESTAEAKDWERAPLHRSKCCRCPESGSLRTEALCGAVESRAGWKERPSTGTTTLGRITSTTASSKEAKPWRLIPTTLLVAAVSWWSWWLRDKGKSGRKKVEVKVLDCFDHHYVFLGYLCANLAL